VSTESAHEKVHTVYELGSFVPLLRISQRNENNIHPKETNSKNSLPSSPYEMDLTEHRALSSPLNGASGDASPENQSHQSRRANQATQIPQSNQAPAGTSKEAQRSIGVLNAFQSNDGDSEAPANMQLDPKHWRAMNDAFKLVDKDGLPQLAKDTMQAMGVDPAYIESTIKATVKQQDADARSKLKIHLYHCNHLGTPVALVNEQGQIDWAIELDPWGNTLNEFQRNSDRPIEQPIRMQGQQINRESGLFYNRYRYYDPAQGRYITQDPIGLAGGTNSTLYITRPTDQIDPLGLQKLTGKYSGSSHQRSVQLDRDAAQIALDRKTANMNGFDAKSSKKDLFESRADNIKKYREDEISATEKLPVACRSIAMPKSSCDANATVPGYDVLLGQT
jgi:RHS repeat-associated protein